MPSKGRRTSSRKTGSSIQKVVFYPSDTPKAGLWLCLEGSGQPTLQVWNPQLIKTVGKESENKQAHSVLMMIGGGEAVVLNFFYWPKVKMRAKTDNGRGGT